MKKAILDCLSRPENEFLCSRKYWAVVFSLGVGPIAVFAFVALISSLGEDTQYTPGYSDKSFNSLAIGSSENLTEKLMGIPFEKKKVSSKSREQYQASSSVKSSRQTIWRYSKQGNDTDNWRNVILRFDSDGRLVEKKNYLVLD